MKRRRKKGEKGTTGTRRRRKKKRGKKGKKKEQREKRKSEKKKEQKEGNREACPMRQVSAPLWIFLEKSNPHPEPHTVVGLLHVVELVEQLPSKFVGHADQVRPQLLRFLEPSRPLSVGTVAHST